MSTTYEETTTTQHSSSSDGIGLDRFYLRSWKGILKIVQAVLCLIAFICASVWINWGPYGGGWVQFVTMSAFILTLVLYFGHLFRFIYKLPGPWGIIELIYYALWALMLLIAAIVAAARGHWHSSIVAAAVFTFAATACFIVDTFFLFRDWQTGRTTTSRQSDSTATTTVTSKETYETRTQY